MFASLNTCPTPFDQLLLHAQISSSTPTSPTTSSLRPNVSKSTSTESTTVFSLEPPPSNTTTTTNHTKLSHWDLLPTEIKTHIFNHADPLTRHLNNQHLSNKPFVQSKNKMSKSGLVQYNQIGTGYVDIARFLFPNHARHRLDKLISEAAAGGNVEILKILFGILEYLSTYGELDEAIKKAAFKGHAEVVDHLLSNFENWSSDALNMAMETACERGYGKLVKVLSKFGQVDMSTYGISAVRLATWSGDAELMQNLVDCGRVDVTMDQNAPWRYACRHGFLGVVKVLVDVDGVDPGACNKEPFRTACRNGHVTVVKVLLQSPGVDPAACENEGFREACRNGHDEVVKVLLSQRNVDPSACDNEGLRLACKNNRVEVVRVLLRTLGRAGGVDLSACDYEAVRGACQNRNTGIVKMLVGKGGKNVAKVALEMAEKVGLKNVVDMIGVP
ncbi:hypothetical protein HDU76_002450 [Blyttiomyces sp. JEL0837]|nr:hypothetical protein HDU76_002450 [Blyttiomyces sp. JEL0837]